MRTIAAILTAVGMIVPNLGMAEPAYEAKADGARIVLHTDKCALGEVVNLPRKATWHQDGKVFEGCWGPRPDMGIIVAFFSDKTAVAIPIQMFVKTTGI